MVIRAGYHSVYAKIVSGWRLEENTMTLQVKVPPNTTASVYSRREKVREIGSSEYWFHCPWNSE